MNTSTFSPLRWVLLSGACTAFLFCVSNASAQNSANAQQSANPGTASGLQIPSAGTEHIQVAGHLPLENMQVNQMFVEQRGSRVYLFLHRPSKRAYAVVDVTRPDEPALLNRDAFKESNSSRMEGPATGSVFAINATPESESGNPQSPALSTETIQFVDMSNPKDIKTVRTFKGVTAMYPDDSRKLVYVVNNDGLWIVSHHMTHPLPLCNSESALTPEPDCQ